MMTQPRDSQSVSRHENVKAKGQSQHHKGQTENVGVQVPQHEAEHGEFGDGIVEALSTGQSVDHPRCPPPPQMTVGE